MPTFLDELHSGRVLLMDGGMGTELQKLGLRLADGENPSSWSLSHAEQVRAIHQDYINSGARVCLTNTFGANERTLPTAISPDELWKQSFDLIDNSTGIYRIADFGPTTDTYEIGELGDMSQFWTDSIIYDRADAVLIETCSTPRVQLAVERIAGETTLPILLSITYQREANGKILSLSGHDPEWFAAHANKWGAAALGVNCGRDIGIDEVVEILHRYREATNLPLFARPNAGTPTIDGDHWTFPLSPAKLAGRLPEILEAGAVMVGGCCGTTPIHIAAMKPIVDTWNARRATL